MPTPPPDPNGRPSSAKRAPVPGHPSPDEARGERVAEASAKDSTNSHHPAASPSGVSGSGNPPAPRPNAGSDILQMLAAPGAGSNSAAVGNTDDAPTVITRSLGSSIPPPTPLNVLAADPPTLAGRRLGNYELIESVGAGGMAAVLKARDLELGRVVALKILPPTAARDPESVTRFKQEARAAALLDHENVARVYACGEDQGLYFIAFEFVEGINLRQMIDRRGTIPADDSVRYMIQVAAGLAHAAERGVVHRDIKPSNILITPDGRAKIVDMGLARELEASADGGLTQSGVTLGTFDYISPEQALDPRRADVRSDIYSLGCTFYHALTGRPPVPEGTAAKKLHAHQHIDPLDPRSIKRDIPDELVVILARMMAKDQTQRYQSPEELIAHLKALAERLNISPDAVGQDSVVRSVRAEPSVRPPRLRLGWVLGVTAVVAAVAAFALSTGDPGPPSQPPPWHAEPRNAKVDPFQPTGTGGQANPVVSPADGVVHNAEQFAARISEANAAWGSDTPPEGPTVVRLAPRTTIDLTKLPEPVVFRGKELELLGSVSPPTILKVNSASAIAASAPPPGAFSAVGADSVSISGVRFETASAPTADSTPRAGFVAADVGGVTLTDCTFPAPPGARAAGVGSVRLTRVGATLRADRCLFAPAAFGLWVPDACDATISDCGFGPHHGAIQIGDSRAEVFIEGPARDATVQLERSSFLLDATSAVVANPPDGDPTGVRVTAGYCVFATIPYSDPLAFLPGVSARQPVIVRAQTHAGDITFTGDRKNAYHGVMALSVASEGGPKFYTFEQCKENQFPVADSTAVALRQRPWAETDPLRVLTDRVEPWRAFRLKLTDAAVFTEDLQVKVIGAQFYNANLLPSRRAYPDPAQSWPPDPPKNGSSTGPTQLVWHPSSEANPLPPNTYTDLQVLLKAARAGDEILIRHNGVWPLDATIDLEKLRGPGAAEFRVTFKPDRGYTPILAPPGRDKLDQALFRLINGKVAFQGVQFLLKPNRPKDGQTVAAVVVVGGESCVFEDCVFTLAEEDDSKAAAVIVPDPRQVMAMAGGTPPTPQVRFERCAIRGKGRGVWVKASRLVDVGLTQSLTAIDGPVFLAEPGGTMTPGTSSILRLNRVTAFVGGPVVEMRGGRIGEMRASGLLPLEVHADECLFAAVPGAGRALVDLDGIDPTEKTLRWEVQSGNRYANFDAAASGTPVMIVRPATDGGTPKESNWDQWVAFAGEKTANAGKPTGKVVFANAPADLAALATFKPADAAIKSVDFPDLPESKPADAGVTEKLPTPATPEP